MCMTYLIYRVTVYGNGTLVIGSVGENDEGTYKCIGISESGPDQTFTSDVILACEYKHTLICSSKGIHSIFHCPQIPTTVFGN